MHTLWISTHVTQPSNHLCALEEGRGGELVWPPELVDVVPPSFQERADGTVTRSALTFWSRNVINRGVAMPSQVKLLTSLTRRE